MVEDKNTNRDINDGSSYYRIWKDTVYGTGRIEARSERDTEIQGGGGASIVIVKWA
jgi:hypothetical protein